MSEYAIEKHRSVARIIDSGVVAVVRASSAEIAEQIVDACVAGGIHAVELTFTVDGAHRIIEKIRRASEDTCVLGAGTVLDSETARIAILSGASYIVSPGFDLPTARCCNRYGIPYMPGCFTATEIIQAMEYGADIIKLFPAGSCSPQTLSAFRAPLPQVNIMPTGGINAQNAKQWIAAGAVALGIGGDLVAGAKTGDFAQITRKASEYLTLVAEARKRTR